MVINNGEDLLSSSVFKTIKEVVQHINKTADENIKAAQKQYKKYFDKRHEPQRKKLGWQ